MSLLLRAQFSDENGVLTTSSSSSGRISPAILFIIIIVAVVFFVSGLLHLLVRFLTKHERRLGPGSGSEPEGPGQRQLQQLFHLHDEGLDQASIDKLPVFLYAEITKEPFDCAVCLCEFADRDRLRLLPLCAHAFHLRCIDTWLLSNATCPLCRGALCSSAEDDNRLFFADEAEEEEGVSGSEIRKRVFSVRLGKFRAQKAAEESEGGLSPPATSSLDSRRCFSMGSYQYVVAESDLRVAEKEAVNGGSSSMRVAKEGESEMKKIGRKGESFSVSKIWQWSTKGKCPTSRQPNLSVVTVQGLPWTDSSQPL